MKRLFHIIPLFFLILSCQAFGQTTDNLRQELQQIISAKNVEVGVAISGNNNRDTLSINGSNRFPLQSVFKLHIALAILSEIDKGKFSFNQKIKIEKKDLIPNLYSPIRDKYPNGTTLPLSKIIEYTVSQSDNVGCDLLFKLIGGPQVVEDYFIKNDIKDVSIKINEEVQQANWDLQFENWTTPKAANEVLSKFYYNEPKLLSKESYNFLWKTLKKPKQVNQD